MKFQRKLTLVFSAVVALTLSGCGMQAPWSAKDNSDKTPASPTPAAPAAPTPAAPVTASLPPSSTEVGGLACDNDFAGCRLTGGELKPDTGSSVKWQVTYDLPCFMGGRSYLSEIEISIGDGAHHRLYFGKSETFTLAGVGALVIKDVVPGVTSSFRFDHDTNCALTLKITPAL